MKLVMIEDIVGKLRSPAMLVSSPGNGDVGMVAVRFMLKSLVAKEFSYIDLSDKILPEAVVVDNGMSVHSSGPFTRLFYAESPDVIFVENRDQLGGHVAISLIRKILEIAKQLSVERIYAAASYSNIASCEDSVEVVMIEIEKRIEKVISLMSEEDYPLPFQSTFQPTETGSPTREQALQKIEQLFEELTENCSPETAVRLKAELDERGLFEIYEDRFLDLFRNEDIL